MAEKDMAVRFVLYDEEEVWMHRECSLDPERDEPDWMRCQAFPFGGPFEEKFAMIQCRRCKRLLGEEPPIRWSKLSVVEVQDVLRRRRDDRLQAINEIAQLSQDLGMYY